MAKNSGNEIARGVVWADKNKLDLEHGAGTSYTPLKKTKYLTWKEKGLRGESGEGLPWEGFLGRGSNSGNNSHLDNVLATTELARQASEIARLRAEEARSNNSSPPVNSPPPAEVSSENKGWWSSLDLFSFVSSFIPSPTQDQNNPQHSESTTTSPVIISSKPDTTAITSDGGITTRQSSKKTASPNAQSSTTGSPTTGILKPHNHQASYAWKEYFKKSEWQDEKYNVIFRALTTKEDIFGKVAIPQGVFLGRDKVQISRTSSKGETKTKEVSAIKFGFEDVEDFIILASQSNIEYQQRFALAKLQLRYESEKEGSGANFDKDFNEKFVAFCLNKMNEQGKLEEFVGNVYKDKIRKNLNIDFRSYNSQNNLQEQERSEVEAQISQKQSEIFTRGRDNSPFSNEQKISKIQELEAQLKKLPSFMPLEDFQQATRKFLESNGAQASDQVSALMTEFARQHFASKKGTPSISISNATASTVSGRAGSYRIGG